MRETNVMIAGFGGQGILFAGKLLASAAMEAGLEVSWLPSYGPAMRGGTANVTVCLSDNPIASPLVTRPWSLMAMNQPSLDKFAPDVRAGGLILWNSSLIKHPVRREDCAVLAVDTREIALEAGFDKAATLVMLGAYVGASEVLAPELVEKTIANEMTGRKAEKLEANLAAFREGSRIGAEMLSPVGGGS